MSECIIRVGKDLINRFSQLVIIGKGLVYAKQSANHIQYFVPHTWIRAFQLFNKHGVGEFCNHFGHILDAIVALKSRVLTNRSIHPIKFLATVVYIL